MFLCFAGIICAKTLYLSVSDQNSTKCSEEPGCSISRLEKNVEVGDEIQLTDSTLAKEEYRQLINASFINTKNITLIGAPTLIDANFSSYPVIKVSKCFLRLKNFDFMHFNTTILKATSSELSIHEIKIQDSIPKLAFKIDKSIAHFKQCKVIRSNCSLFYALSSKISYIEGEIRYINISREMNVLVSTNLKLKRSTISDCDCTMLVSAMNSTKFKGTDLKTENCIFTTLAQGVKSNITFLRSNFNKVRGRLSVIDNGKFNSSIVKIEGYDSLEPLVEVISTSLFNLDLNVKDSSVASLFTCMNSKFEADGISIKSLDTSSSLFAFDNTDANLKNIYIKKIITNGDVPILHCNKCNKLQVYSIKAKNIISKSESGSAIVISNVESANIKDVEYYSSSIPLILSNSSKSKIESIILKNSEIISNSKLQLGYFNVFSNSQIEIYNVTAKNCFSSNGFFFVYESKAKIKNIDLSNISHSGTVIKSKAYLRHLNIKDSNCSQLFNIYGSHFDVKHAQFLSNNISSSMFHIANSTTFVITNMLSKSNNKVFLVSEGINNASLSFVNMSSHVNDSIIISNQTKLQTITVFCNGVLYGDASNYVPPPTKTPSQKKIKKESKKEQTKNEHKGKKGKEHHKEIPKIEENAEDSYQIKSEGKSFEISIMMFILPISIILIVYFLKFGGHRKIANYFKHHKNNMKGKFIN